MHLRLCHWGAALVLLRQEETDGHEELVDADAELLLVLAAGGQREETARLDNVLEDVLAGLQDKTDTKNNKVFKSGKIRPQQSSP